MSDEIAIKVENLSKCFHIYDQPRDRLKQMILPRLQRAVGAASRQYFREFWALKNLNFEVKKGETVGIIGRNGSGKSTLLQMICGTLNPTSGSIQTYGRIAALLELGSGFNPEFTGRENVYMNGAVLGLSREEVDQRFNEIAAFADIGQFIEQPVKTYSSGMMVRLAFAVAINVDPDILIVDEALSVGDELFQRKCFSRIEVIKNNGASILFVSHSASMVNQLCGEAIFIDRGELLLRGAPREVTKKYHQLLFSSSENENQVIESIKKISSGAPQSASGSELKCSLIAEYVDELKVVESLSYHSFGGKIVSFELLDVNFNKVNLVASGFSGLVKLVVRFDKPFENVTFGFHLKSVSGLEVAGLSYPPLKESLVTVVEGEVFEVFWRVNLILTAGSYFFTYGVRSMSENGFIDRAVDAAIVKVIERENSTAYGLCDISNQDQCWCKRI